MPAKQEQPNAYYGYSRVWNISAALLLSFEDFFLPTFSFSTYTIIHI